MTTREAVERSIRKLASLYLDERWEWGDVSREEFAAAVSDFTGRVSAAMDDCFHDYREEKERTNGLRSDRTALAGDGASDSDLNSREPDAQQDVGERRVGAREFDRAAVAEMAQEMERAREGRDA